MLPNHLRLGSTLATVPEANFDWNGAGRMTLPDSSLLALKFLYICSLLIVALSLGRLTPFKLDVFLSGFMLHKSGKEMRFEHFKLNKETIENKKTCDWIC